MRLPVDFALPIRLNVSLSLLRDKLTLNMKGDAMSRKIIAVITAVTGDRVIVSEETMKHVLDEHYRGIPQDIIKYAVKLARLGVRYKASAR